MKPNETKPNEMSQLARGFSTACKKAVTEGKAQTYAAPMVLAALTALTVTVKPNTLWT